MAVSTRNKTVLAERIPLSGETVKGSELKYIPGGKGADQAVAMTGLGAQGGMPAAEDVSQRIEKRFLVIRDIFWAMERWF